MLILWKQEVVDSLQLSRQPLISLQEMLSLSLVLSGLLSGLLSRLLSGLPFALLSGLLPTPFDIYHPSRLSCSRAAPLHVRARGASECHRGMLMRARGAGFGALCARECSRAHPGSYAGACSAGEGTRTGHCAEEDADNAEAIMKGTACSASVICFTPCPHSLGSAHFGFIPLEVVAVSPLVGSFFFEFVSKHGLGVANLPRAKTTPREGWQERHRRCD